MSNHAIPTTLSQNFCTITQQAVLWARQAGQIALPYFHNVTVERKADNTLLTEADLAIEQFLVAQIHTAYPTHDILTEEGTAPTSSPSPITNPQLPTSQSPNLPTSQSPNLPISNPQSPPSPYTWVIDPLDGTTVFARGLPGWGIAIALLYQGQPVMGLFYMPLLDDLTYSCLGSASGFCQGRPLTAAPGQPCQETPGCPYPKVLGQSVQPDWANNGFLAVTAGAHKTFQIDVSRTRALGSIGASLIYTARGSATAAFIPKAYLWDLAPGALILDQCGGELRYLSGRLVDLAELLDGRLTTEPILAGEPGVVAQLRQTIRHH